MNTLAIVFPGQGSQSIGMLATIAEKYPEIQETFIEASDILSVDLWALAQHGPESELNKTMYTQPVLLAASYALWKLLKGMHPAFLAGHSLGEYSALVCAGALSFPEAIKIVHARGQFMQEAVPVGVGGMAAIIGLDESVVHEICEQVRLPNEVLSPANYNSIGQVVIAGHLTAIHRALPKAKEKGAKLAVLLPVSVPSHCALMQPAAKKLQTLLDQVKWHQPTIPVVGNATLLVYDHAVDIRAGLTKQLYLPVRWVETIQFFVRKGVNTIIECGAGKVLTGLNKRIDKRINVISTADIASLESLK